MGGVSCGRSRRIVAPSHVANMCPVSATSQLCFFHIDGRLAGSTLFAQHLCDGNFEYRGPSSVHIVVYPYNYLVAHSTGGDCDAADAPRSLTFAIPRFNLLDWSIAMERVLHKGPSSIPNDETHIIQAVVPRLPWFNNSVRIARARTLIDGAFHSVDNYVDALAAGLPTDARFAIQTDGCQYWVHDLRANRRFVVSRQDLLHGFEIGYLLRCTELTQGESVKVRYQSIPASHITS